MKHYNTDNRADYCEMFESISDFASEKIPRGTSVVFDHEDKIRPALKGEEPFGVISSYPIMIGNSGGSDCGRSWGGKYIKDEFGNFVLEDTEIWYSEESNKKGKKKHGYVSNGDKPENTKTRIKKIPKLNPDYDETKPYVHRLDRNEWNIVGLLGRLKILKGQPVAKNWMKLKDISENVEEWLIR